MNADQEWDLRFGRWSPGRVRLATASGFLKRSVEYIEIAAFVRHGWAVHPALDSSDYGLTHVGTGLNFGNFGSLEMAKIVAVLIDCACPAMAAASTRVEAQEAGFAAVQEAEAA